MATVNPELLEVTAPSGPGGYRMVYLLVKTAAGHLRGTWRGFGGPTAVNGANTTSPAMHVAVAETYDDDWQVTAYTVDDSPSVQLCATPLANRKAVTLTMNGTAGASVFIGKTSAVTASAGGAAGTIGIEVMLDTNGYGAATFPFGALMTLWAITSSGASVTIRATEMS